MKNTYFIYNDTYIKYKFNMSNTLSNILETLTTDPNAEIDKLIKEATDKYPYANDVKNNSYSVEDKSIDELIEVLETYSYLNISAEKVVREIVWLSGEREETFYRLFQEKDGKYFVRTDIDNIVLQSQMKIYYPKLYELKELNCRFNYYSTNLRFMIDIYSKGCIIG